MTSYPAQLIFQSLLGVLGGLPLPEEQRHPESFLTPPLRRQLLHRNDVIGGLETAGDTA